MTAPETKPASATTYVLRQLTPADRHYANGTPVPQHKLDDWQTVRSPYGPYAGYGDAEDDE
ncbi:MAG TPA: hypothetical protein VHP58_01620 [Alphaproteobacteria bacterium]|nr:hypothetical protein [Alphaproteobacteria bacterium]